MGIMKNRLVKEFVIEVDKEIKKLEKEYPFDEPEKLQDLYSIINIFFNKFREAYEPYQEGWEYMAGVRSFTEYVANIIYNTVGKYVP